jgi:beta-phosphoglucomutase
MESLEIILEQAHKSYTEAEKLELTQRKNQYYVNFLKENLTPDDILPGVVSLLRELKSLNVKVAIGSSSKNTPLILDKIQLTSCFDVIVDGNQISRTKPDPEVFELAARKLVVEPRHCVVVEDAEAGIAAALACGMRPVGVGAASNLNHLFLGVNSLADIQAKDLLADTLREKKGSNNLANDEGVST